MMSHEKIEQKTAIARKRINFPEQEGNRSKVQFEANEFTNGCENFKITLGLIDVVL